MKTDDFNYDLPESFIAQTPIEPRHNSRLLVLDRGGEDIEHCRFWEIGKYLKSGDLLVINQTRVIPARMFAQKLPGGGKIELLLLRKQDALQWVCMVGGKGLNPGRKIVIENGPGAEIKAMLIGPQRLIRFDAPIEDYFVTAGHVPLPPYIHQTLSDPERYQTVYAQTPGSAAAPTAGLHFTQELMDKLRSEGIKFAELTLHVGLDTFAPVNETDPEEHLIHSEWCTLSQDTADLINKTRLKGGRVIAVGTTSVRTLESAVTDDLEMIVKPYSGETNLFILPGYTFKIVDGLITNFHLPKSTLLMLVSAFAGHKKILNAYEIAKEEGYRFFSFGDAMLIQ
ncbi:MAG: tRNA preQ1(34) S-adenosylmethionine ribosyltransferase-isomerase QueA [Chloroflexota bacterium]